MKLGYKAPSYYNISSLLKIDTSKIIFETKKEISKISLMTDKDKDLFSEKVITIDMVENDFIVKMPPKNRYKVRVRVKEVKRGEPRVVQPDEF